MFRLARFTPIEHVDRLAAAFTTRKPPPVAMPCHDFGGGCRNVVVYESRFGRLCRQEMVWALIPGHIDPRTMVRSAWTEATVEEAREGRELRHAWRSQRCVVPADAIFAFTNFGKHPQRYCIRRADSLPMFIAALWDANDKQRALERDHRGLCLLTHKVSEGAGAMFPTIPVILSPAAVHPWASPAICEDTDLERLILPDKAEVVVYPVDNDAIGAQLLVAYTPPDLAAKRK